MEAGATVRISFPAPYNVAAYVFRGATSFAGSSLQSGQLGHFPVRDGSATAACSTASVEAAADRNVGASFLFIAGQPLHEPIAWGGPIVMNTREELHQAFTEYEKGTFIKTSASGM